MQGQGLSCCLGTSQEPVLVAYHAFIQIESVRSEFPEVPLADLQLGHSSVNACARIGADFLISGLFDGKALARYAGKGRAMLSVFVSAKPPGSSKKPSFAAAEAASTSAASARP